MKRFLIGSSACLMLVLAGCKPSHHVDITVRNETGTTIRLLEVDYPNASFGADSVGSGSVLHYKVQLQGTGPVKVQYTAPDNHQPQITGPVLHENTDGKLEIVLLPADKADFKNE